MEKKHHWVLNGTTLLIPKRCAGGWRSSLLWLRFPLRFSSPTTPCMPNRWPGRAAWRKIFHPEPGIEQGWENHDCPQSSSTFWSVLEFAHENVVERCRKSCFTLVIDAFHVSHLGSFRFFFLPRRAFRGTQVGYVSQYCDLSRCTSLRGINRIARKMSCSQNRGKPVSFTASCGPSHQPLSGFENNVGA